MRVGDSWRKLASSDLGVLVLWATAGVLLHTVTNGQYGFHHDELATLDDARSLAWGYVAYPPLTPFLARIAFILFGPSLIGLRFFAAVALGLVLVLTGLMARHLGGGRQAQIVAALAAAIGGVAFSAGTLFQYVSFDYLWWVAAAYFMVRLLASDDPRWCLAVGAAIGLGMLTKYTMMFLVVGIAAGFLFTPARRHLRRPWLWYGIALPFVIFLPNFLWQIRHHFVSLDFLTLATSASDEPIHLCLTSSGSRRTLPLSHCGWPASSICSPPRTASGIARLVGCSLSLSSCS
jgi:4-amino-4-deoxy-L-arabinose transferase-like glycosyltransferase